ncbi:MAG: hypothetical protein IIW94_02230 [Clostridia bacterium]|nr:hypothetical protein [Clostridia bacterium]
MKIKIAELNVDIANRGKYIEKLSEKYIADFTVPDISIQVSNEEIEAERTATEGKFSTGYCEATAAYRKIGYLLPNFDAFILHGATFRIKNRGIAFLAASGTGKSRHMQNWISLFGEQIEVVNGDKPIIRFKDNLPFAYGTPWCGKESLSNNTSVRLTDICFIVRGKENKTRLLSKEDITLKLLNQVVIPKGSENIVKTLELIDRMVKHCNVWEIKCTADVSSAEVSSKVILEVD